MSRGELARALAAFATSTIATLRETIGIEAAFRGDPLAGAQGARVTVAIEVTGDLRRVTWGFPVALTRELTRRMVGEARAELDEAAAIELANILTGRGAATLEEHGLQVELATAHIAAGEAAGVRVRLVTAAGPIEIAFEPGRLAA